MNTKYKIHNTQYKILVFAAFYFLFFISLSQAATLILVSDTISTSIPGINANHTIRFTVTNTISVSGKIIVAPQAGAFTIPAGLDFSDIDFLVDGANQTLGALPGSGSGSAIGVSVTTSTSGSITFTLNNADALAAESAIIIKIGTNATFNIIGDQQIQNPDTVGSYRISIQTKNFSGTLLDLADAMVAILLPINVGLYETLSTLNEIFSPTIATTTTLSNPDGTKLMVELPQNFVDFSDDINFQIASFQKEDFAPTASPPSGKSAVGAVYEVNIFRVLDGSSVTSFSKSITFDFFYSDSDISGINESALQPYRWDGIQWVLLGGSTVFSDENRVSVPVSSFSTFSLMGEPPPASLAEKETIFTGGGGGAAPFIKPIAEEAKEIIHEIVFEKPIAEMTVAELKVKITEILKVIAILKTQLKRALAKDMTKIIPSEYTFIRNLSYGEKNDDVKYLQVFLKDQGTEIYPEGLITGYFGPLTKAAIVRFQEKYTKDILYPWGLTKGTGFFGKTTKAKINEILSQF